MAFPALERREHRRILQVCRLLPAVLAALAVLAGTGALVAWAAGYGAITGGTGPIVMLPLTAALIILSGLSLLIAQRRESRIATFASRFLAVAVGGIALVIMFEYGMGRRFGLDLLWFQDPEIARASPRRMALNTALAFVLFSQGLIFLEGDRRARGLKSQVFATLVLIIAFIAVVGHVFDVRDFYSFSLLAGMSLSAAITLIFVGAGLLFSQLDRGVPALIVDDGAAGFVARRAARVPPPRWLPAARAVYSRATRRNHAGDRAVPSWQRGGFVEGGSDAYAACCRPALAGGRAILRRARPVPGREHG